MLPIGCFLLGIVIDLYTEEDDSSQRLTRIFILHYSTLVTVALTGGLLIISVIEVTVVARAIKPTPIILMSSTGSRPNLELSNKYHSHVFLSHIWSTSKAKNHNIVRMLQLYVPGIRN